MQQRVVIGFVATAREQDRRPSGSCGSALSRMGDELVGDTTAAKEPHIVLQVIGALIVSLLLVLFILYLTGSWFSNDWNPFDGAGEPIDWSGVARISVPAAGLVGASVAIVLGYHGQMTKVRELENDRDVALTHRFTEAVGQLGDPSLPVRLGGLYALERIAIDSVRDRAIVSEVLGAFVRDSDQADLAPDRLAAVLIASRARRLGWGERVAFDFTNAKLRGLTLPASETLRSSIFVGADLSGARLRGVDFRDSDFSEAYLQDADFSSCDLIGCTFSPSAFTQGADFTGAKTQQTKGFPRAS